MSKWEIKIFKTKIWDIEIQVKIDNETIWN